MELWLTLTLAWMKRAAPALEPHTQTGGREAVQVSAVLATTSSVR